MKILGIECSAGPVSAAVCENGEILSCVYANIHLTHSQTLLPMITQALDDSKTALRDIGCIAAAAGPGSFTGIRIGISAVKGLAMPMEIPCAAVSTLRAMAEPFRGNSCIVCAVMDARCNQVYNAMFEVRGNEIIRLCEDRALICDILAKEVEQYAENGCRPVVITGDGASLFTAFTAGIKNVYPAAPQVRFQSAAGVCLAAEGIVNDGKTVTPDELLPVYLRLPQAERELKRKQAERT